MNNLIFYQVTMKKFDLRRLTVELFIYLQTKEGDSVNDSILLENMNQSMAVGRNLIAQTI